MNIFAGEASIIDAYKNWSMKVIPPECYTPAVNALRGSHYYATEIHCAMVIFDVPRNVKGCDAININNGVKVYVTATERELPAV